VVYKRLKQNSMISIH